MSELINAETRKLIEGAQRFVGSGVPELDESPVLDLTEYVMEAPCSTGLHGSEVPTVHVHPMYRYAARCADCIRNNVPLGGPVLADTRTSSLTYEDLRAPYVVDVPEERVEHPRPVVTALGERPEGVGVPAPVLKLQERAEGLGWHVNVTYAKGRGIHGVTGKPTKLVESWALRMSREGLRAVAVYEDGSWGSLWGVKHMFKARTVMQLDQYLRLAGTDLVDPFIRQARAENAKAEATKPCTSGKAHPAHEYMMKTSGETRYCLGRQTAKVKKTKESAG